MRASMFVGYVSNLKDVQALASWHATSTGWQLFSKAKATKSKPVVDGVLERPTPQSFGRPSISHVIIPEQRSQFCRYSYVAF